MSFIYAKLLLIVCVAYVISEVVTHKLPLWYFEGFFTYMYGMSILFLLYVFCFLLQESACCSRGTDTPPPPPRPPKPPKEPKDKNKKKDKKDKKESKNAKNKKDFQVGILNSFNRHFSPELFLAYLRVNQGLKVAQKILHPDVIFWITKRQMQISWKKYFFFYVRYKKKYKESIDFLN